MLAILSLGTLTLNFDKDSALNKAATIANVNDVYMIYFKSKLFYNKKLTSEQTKFVQDEYFKWERYSNCELERIKIVIDSLGDSYP